MKLYAPRLISGTLVGLSLCALLAASSCQDSEKMNRPDGPITVKIPAPEGDSYKLVNVELTTLRDAVQMQGEAAKFMYSPALVDGHLQGYEPRVRLTRTTDGVYVAEDSFSLQLLALYANFEKLMKMDAELGVKNLNPWPQPVAVNTRIVDGSGQTSHDNARYSGDLDSFLFDPFTREDLPLTVNAGVIGHEHFHSFFYKIVLRNLGGFYTKVPNADPHKLQSLLASVGLQNRGERASDTGFTYNETQVYQLALLRGVNEGLADVWGWIYSGDTNFVNRSLGFEKRRDLKLFADAMPTQKSFADQTRSYADPTDVELLDKSYMLGSKYAQTLHHVVEVESLRRARATDDQNKKQGLKKGPTDPKNFEPALRQALARAVLRTLPRLTTSVQALKAEELMAPTRTLEILSEEIPFMGEETCQAMKDKVPESSKAAICKTMSAEAKAEKKAMTP